MLETECKEIIDKNTFLIHFIDKNSDKVDSELTNEINNYETGDESEIMTALRINAIPKAVSIDVKIKYPETFYNPNYYELLNVNEKWFLDFYNNSIMNSNKTMDYSEIADSKVSCEVKSK